MNIALGADQTRTNNDDNRMNVRGTISGNHRLTKDGGGRIDIFGSNSYTGTGETIDRIAILLDGEVITAPVIVSEPLGKHFVITGLDGPGEAESLAIALMVPLANPLTVAEIRPIPPQGK